MCYPGDNAAPRFHEGTITAYRTKELPEDGESNPDAPPHPRCRPGAVRRAEPALDPGAGVTRHRRSARPLTDPRPPGPTSRGHAACPGLRPRPRIGPPTRRDDRRRPDRPRGPSSRACPGRHPCHPSRATRPRAAGDRTAEFNDPDSNSYSATSHGLGMTKHPVWCSAWNRWKRSLTIGRSFVVGSRCRIGVQRGLEVPSPGAGTISGVSRSQTKVTVKRARFVLLALAAMACTALGGS